MLYNERARVRLMYARMNVASLWRRLEQLSLRGRPCSRSHVGYVFALLAYDWSRSRMAFYPFINEAEFTSTALLFIGSLVPL